MDPCDPRPGTALAHRVGLGAPVFEAAAASLPLGPPLLPQLGPGLVAGLIAGVLLTATSVITPAPLS